MLLNFCGLHNITFSVCTLDQRIYNGILVHKILITTGKIFFAQTLFSHRKTKIKPLGNKFNGTSLLMGQLM